MKKLCVSACALALLVLLTGIVFALEIRVAPRTLVLSSSGGNLTVHTDVPFRSVESVDLFVNETQVGEEEIGIFFDSRLNLVVQCSKDAVKNIVGDIEKKTVPATITLIVNDVPDSEQIRVKQ